MKMCEAPQPRTTFRSCDVEKARTVVPSSDHFWTFRCRTSARHCGTKHISKSKCRKRTNIGPLFEVEMSKKCTPLWREAQFQVKSVNKLRGSDHFLTFRCRKIRYTPLHSTPFHSTPLHSTPLHYDHHYNYNYTTTTVHSTPLHSTPLQLQLQIQLQYNYSTLHYTTLHLLQYSALQYAPKYT